MKTIYSNKPIVVYLQGHLSRPDSGKMGIGMLRFSQNPIACVIDRDHAGKNVQDVLAVEHDCPVVATVAEAQALGAEVMVLGAAILGGVMPEGWFEDIDLAVALGLSVVNGLHTKIAQRYSQLKPGQEVIDIRQEPENAPIASGRAAQLNNRRVLFVGTDMSIGKMTCGLVLNRVANTMGINSEFLATGQTGIAICGKGIPLDAIRIDFCAGAVEQLVVDHPAELVFIEGQGSLLHPASSATLPLLRGSCPTHLILCHRANYHALKDHSHITIPDLNAFIRLYEDLAAVCGAFLRPQTVALCLNTAGLSDEQARQAVSEAAQQTDLLVTDVLRYPCEAIIKKIMES